MAVFQATLTPGPHIPALQFLSSLTVYANWPVSVPLEQTSWRSWYLLTWQMPHPSLCNMLSASWCGCLYSWHPLGMRVPRIAIEVSKQGLLHLNMIHQYLEFEAFCCICWKNIFHKQSSTMQTPVGVGVQNLGWLVLAPSSNAPDSPLDSDVWDLGCI